MREQGMQYTSQASSFYSRYARYFVSACSGGTRLLVFPAETALPENGERSTAGTLCLLDELIVGGVCSLGLCSHATN